MSSPFELPQVSPFRSLTSGDFTGPWTGQKPESLNRGQSLIQGPPSGEGVKTVHTDQGLAVAGASGLSQSSEASDVADRRFATLEDVSLHMPSESDEASVSIAGPFAQCDCLDLTSAPGGPNWDESASATSQSEAPVDDGPDGMFSGAAALVAGASGIRTTSSEEEEDAERAGGIANGLAKSLRSMAQNVGSGAGPEEPAPSNPTAGRFAQLFDLDPEEAGEVSATFDRSEWLFGDSAVESERDASVQGEGSESSSQGALALLGLEGMHLPNEVTRFVASVRSSSPVGSDAGSETPGFATLVVDAPLAAPTQGEPSGADMGGVSTLSVQVGQMAEPPTSGESVEDESVSSAPSTARFATVFDVDPEAAGEVSGTAEQSEWLFGDSEGESDRGGSVGNGLPECGSQGGIDSEDVMLLSFTPMASAVVGAAGVPVTESLTEERPASSASQCCLVLEGRPASSASQCCLVLEERPASSASQCCLVLEERPASSASQCCLVLEERPASPASQCCLVFEERSQSPQMELVWENKKPAGSPVAELGLGVTDRAERAVSPMVPAGLGRAERATSPVLDFARMTAEQAASPLPDSVLFSEAQATSASALSMKSTGSNVGSGHVAAGKRGSGRPSGKVSRAGSLASGRGDAIGALSETGGSVEDESFASAPSAARFAQLMDLDPEDAGEVSGTIDKSDWLFGDSDAESDRNSVQDGPLMVMARADSPAGWTDNFADDGFAMLVFDVPLVRVDENQSVGARSGQSSKLSIGGQNGSHVEDATGTAENESVSCAPSDARFAQLIDVDPEAAGEMSATGDGSDWLFGDSEAELERDATVQGDQGQPAAEDSVTLSFSVTVDSSMEALNGNATGVSVCPVAVEVVASSEFGVSNEAGAGSVVDESVSSAPTDAHFAQLLDLDPEAAGEVSGTLDPSEQLLGDSEADSEHGGAVPGEDLVSVMAGGWPGDITEGGFAMLVLDAPLINAPPSVEAVCSPEVSVVATEGVANSVQDDSVSLAPSAARFIQLKDLDPEDAGEMSATLDRSDWLFGDSEIESVQSEQTESVSQGGQVIEDQVDLPIMRVVQSDQLTNAPGIGMTGNVEEESSTASVSQGRFVQLVELDEEAMMDLSSVPCQEELEEPEQELFGLGEAVTLVFGPPVSATTSVVPVETSAATAVSGVEMNDTVPVNTPAVENVSAQLDEPVVCESMSLVLEHPIASAQAAVVGMPVVIEESSVSDPKLQQMTEVSNACGMTSGSGMTVVSAAAPKAAMVTDSGESAICAKNEIGSISMQMGDGFASLVFEVPDAKAAKPIAPGRSPANPKVARQSAPTIDTPMSALVSALTGHSTSVAVDSADASRSSSVSADRYIQASELETPRVTSGSDGSLALDARYLQCDDIDSRGIPGMMTDSSRPDSAGQSFVELEAQQMIAAAQQQRVRNPRRAGAGARMRRPEHSSRPEVDAALEAEIESSVTLGQGVERRETVSVREPGGLRSQQGRPSIPSPRRQRTAAPGAPPSLASRFLAGSKVACDDPETLAATVWELEDRLETSAGGARFAESARTERAVEIARAQLMDSLKRQNQDRRQAEVVARSTCSRTEVEEFQRIMAQREQQLEVRLREQVQQLRERQSKEIAEQDAQWMTEPKQRLFNRSSQKVRALRLQRQLMMSPHRVDEPGQSGSMGRSDSIEAHGGIVTEFDGSRGQLEQKHREEMETLLQACDVRRGEFRFLKETLARRFNGRSSGMKGDDQNGSEADRLWERTHRNDGEQAVGLTGSSRRKVVAGKTLLVGEFNALPLPPLAKEAASRRRNRGGIASKA